MNNLSKVVLVVVGLIFSTQYFHASCSEEFEGNSLFDQPRLKTGSQLSKNAMTSLPFEIQTKVFWSR